MRSGGVAAFPTETVYGLGADAGNESGLETIFRLKGRPLDNPIIAHVSGAAQARTLAAIWDERCERAARRWWPGPFTLVVPKAAAVSERLTAGRATVALRAPDHDVARRLIDRLGAPIAAPSANRSGHVSPTTARHVADDFADEASLLIIDGGPCRIGIESTVLEINAPGAPARVLRPGGIAIEALREVLGDVDASAIERQDAGPGTSPRHYAPQTPCELLATCDLAARLESEPAPVAVIGFDPAAAPAPHYFIRMPSDAAAYAAALYDALRRADALGPARIIVETPPTGRAWRAVHDRLRRASG